jgi:hypothetical protein
MGRKFIYDSKTTNKSFIKMYKVLKALGIKNNKFFLKLYDKTLQGVDPFDEENLTTDQKTRINIEVRINPWYYFREIVRYPASGGLVRLELHRGNLAIIFCMLNNFNITAMLPRQPYKTGSTITAYSWLYYYGTEFTNMLFIHKSTPDSERNLKILKDIYDLTPEYLKNTSKKDIDNVKYIKCENTKNTITAVGAANSELEADKKGRGCTTALQLLR